MPCKVSGDHYYWDAAKERKFLLQLDEYLASSDGKHPPKATLEIWATQFNAEFGGVPAHGMTLYQKKKRMKKIYRGWKAMQSTTGLGYDKSAYHVICSDEAWQSFLEVHKECNHLRYEGLRNKELYFSIFEKNHAAGASGCGSVTMPPDSSIFGDVEASLDYSENRVDLEKGCNVDNRWASLYNNRARADVGPSRSGASSGKWKRREETDKMTFLAMQEIVSHFRDDSQSGHNNETTSRPDHMIMCMNIMIEMGVPLNERFQMWHYLDANPRRQRSFHQLTDVDRRLIIASVV